MSGESAPLTCVAKRGACAGRLDPAPVLASARRSGVVRARFACSSCGKIYYRCAFCEVVKLASNVAAHERSAHPDQQKPTYSLPSVDAVWPDEWPDDGDWGSTEATAPSSGFPVFGVPSGALPGAKWAPYPGEMCPVEGCTRPLAPPSRPPAKYSRRRAFVGSAASKSLAGTKRAPCAAVVGAACEGVAEATGPVVSTGISVRWRQVCSGAGHAGNRCRFVRAFCSYRELGCRAHCLARNIRKHELSVCDFAPPSVKCSRTPPKPRPSKRPRVGVGCPGVAAEGTAAPDVSRRRVRGLCVGGSSPAHACASGAAPAQPTAGAAAAVAATTAGAAGPSSAGPAAVAGGGPASPAAVAVAASLIAAGAGADDNKRTGPATQRQPQNSGQIFVATAVSQYYGGRRSDIMGVEVAPTTAGPAAPPPPPCTGAAGAAPVAASTAADAAAASVAARGRPAAASAPPAAVADAASLIAAGEAYLAEQRQQPRSQQLAQQNKQTQRQQAQQQESVGQDRSDRGTVRLFIRHFCTYRNVGPLLHVPRADAEARLSGIFSRAADSVEYGRVHDADSDCDRLILDRVPAAARLLYDDLRSNAVLARRVSSVSCSDTCRGLLTAEIVRDLLLFLTGIAPPPVMVYEDLREGTGVDAYMARIRCVAPEGGVHVIITHAGVFSECTFAGGVRLLNGQLVIHRGPLEVDPPSSWGLPPTTVVRRPRPSRSALAPEDDGWADRFSSAVRAYYGPDVFVSWPADRARGVPRSYLGRVLCESPAGSVLVRYLDGTTQVEPASTVCTVPARGRATLPAVLPEWLAPPPWHWGSLTNMGDRCWDVRGSAGAVAAAPAAPVPGGGAGGAPPASAAGPAGDGAAAAAPVVEVFYINLDGSVGRRQHMESWAGFLGLAVGRVPAVASSDPLVQSLPTATRNPSEKATVLSHCRAAHMALGKWDSLCRPDNFWAVILEDDTSPTVRDPVACVRRLVLSLPAYVHCVQLHTVQPSVVAQLSLLAAGRPGATFVDGYGHGCQAYAADVVALRRIAAYVPRPGDSLPDPRMFSDGYAWCRERKSSHECAVYSRCDTVVFVGTMFRHECDSFKSQIHQSHSPGHVKAQRAWDSMYAPTDLIGSAGHHPPYCMGRVFFASADPTCVSTAPAGSILRHYDDEMRGGCSGMRAMVVAVGKWLRARDLLPPCDPGVDTYAATCCWLRQRALDSRVVRVHLRLGGAFGNLARERSLRPGPTGVVSSAIVRAVAGWRPARSVGSAPGAESVVLHAGWRADHPETSYAYTSQIHMFVSAGLGTQVSSVRVAPRAPGSYVDVVAEADSAFVDLLSAGAFVRGRGEFSRLVAELREHCAVGNVVELDELCGDFFALRPPPRQSAL